METILIRNYQPQDLEAITELTSQLGYPTTTDEMKSRMEHISGRDDCRTLVAVKAHSVVGYAGMVKGFYWEKNGSFLRIQALVVHHHHRKAGIGRKLIEAAILHATTIKAGAVLLNSGNRPERKEAHQFYPKLGFEATSTGYVKKINT
ncbi:GNAT family N-acetyltransferase [Niabella beijingensis]|uniref:GNAT family N-acetyltransferase n=1 Tax=Niabella beijingensis TaxID=2872700 RepID=UPI001CBAD361|nr:GNAT family N-acetyltransferase [Niabella beijingensis]MBZ4187533.1 GNAT family N-acetyltransferase [Niabella beijingensis]